MASFDRMARFAKQHLHSEQCAFDVGSNVGA